MRMKSLLTLALVAAVPALAQATQVSYTGSVTSLTYADCTTFLNGGCTAWSFTPLQSTDFLAGQFIEVGQSFVGRFAYDESAPMTAVSADGYQAVFLNSVSQSAVATPTFSLPTASLPAAGLGSFSIVDGRFGWDSFFVMQSFSQGDWFANLIFDLQDSTGTIFSGFDVPTRLDLSQFDFMTFQIGMLRRSDGDQVQLHGAIASVSVVPEPGTLALLLTGAALLAHQTRRARASQETPPK